MVSIPIAVVVLAAGGCIHANAAQAHKWPYGYAWVCAFYAFICGACVGGVMTDLERWTR